MAQNVVLSTRKGLFILQRSGADWKVAQSAFLGDNVTLALPDRRDGSLYAALNHGHFGVKLHRSDDMGKTWAACMTPAYPEPDPNAEPDLDPMRKTPIPYSTQLIWALEAGGANQPGVLWAGTVPGGLFRSGDRGMTWELNRPLWDDPRRRQWFGGGMDFAGLHSICVDPRDANNVAIGVSCGGVWVTQDGGQSWECRGEGMTAAYLPPEQAGNPAIQDAHRLVQCPANPDALWVQHHNGIFRSTDRGRRWTEVKDGAVSTFGFGVAVHPVDPATAWFVPAKKDEQRYPADGRFCVTRTRDGGQTLQSLTRGLPQEHAYDLVYRHSLDVADDGSSLMVGSTTGNVWASSDGGENWQCVSSTLPPISAVRFI
ncbi:MAG: hypothetical protein K1X57_05320 [Gemmataceae bacterium]|nr:hypothetical protein [Gemmataceae bacterium]